jgi:hypothetical protein
MEMIIFKSECMICLPRHASYAGRPKTKKLKQALQALQYVNRLPLLLLACFFARSQPKSNAQAAYWPKIEQALTQ